MTSLTQDVVTVTSTRVAKLLVVVDWSYPVTVTCSVMKSTLLTRPCCQRNLLIRRIQAVAMRHVGVDVNSLNKKV